MIGLFPLNKKKLRHPGQGLKQFIQTTDGKVMEMDVKELIATLPTTSQPMKLEPIRFCAACYSDLPYHRLEWQFKSTVGCDRHRLRLLSKCPSCGERFPAPAEWVKGRCNKCGMKYGSMAKKQKSY